MVHVIRIHAIYDKNRSILFGMSTLFAVQVVVTAVCCAFYRCMPRFYRSFLLLLILFQYKIFSCPPPWRPGMYRRSSTILGGCLLGSSHPPLLHFSQNTLSVTSLSWSESSSFIVCSRCHALCKISSVATTQRLEIDAPWWTQPLWRKLPSLTPWWKVLYYSITKI